MKDQLISFETAKLAREKRADFYSEDFYFNDTGAFSTSLHPVCNSDKITKTYTQSLLQKWLREVHNVHVWVTYNYPINGKYVYVLMFRNSIETFNSYEEALEQGLIEALKLTP